ncbi:MAG: hypothetical protein AB201_02850 [Parcubacteria bacterium C7867-006]|nr:MAG: hypothetical protein AB201_02850 [Parcubacteria bacterium C7867-006]
MLRRLLLIVLLLSFNTAYAEVSQFVFITEPQIIPVNTNSETITIQSQNSDGISENITETNDLVFSSTSGTGEFLSTSGNPVTTTMSKNTANKNFLYKDSTPGTYTITVTATGRTNLKTFSASQQIVVGSSASGNTDTATTTQEEVTSTSPPQTNNYSAHSSPAPLSTTENKIDFEISAGRDRLTSVGNQVVLKAVATKTQNVSEQNISYAWSFGDGTVGLGSTVSHSYRFPGNYNVVLNGSYSDKQAVSRISIKVVLSELTISRLVGGYEVTNKSKSEINLGDWSLVSDKKSFVFPADTLIPSGEKIVFADEITGLMDGEVKLLNPLGKSFAVYTSNIGLVAGANISNTEVIDVEKIQAKIDEVKNTVSQISTQINPKPSVKVATEKAPETPKNEDQLANVVQVFEAPQRNGLSAQIMSWPVRGFSFIKHLFVE